MLVKGALNLTAMIQVFFYTALWVSLDIINDSYWFGIK